MKACLNMSIFKCNQLIYIFVGALSGLFVYSLGNYYSYIDPYYIEWLYRGFDSKQGHIAWRFFSTDKWQFPILGSNPNYGDALGSSIVYADIMPLIAIIAKAIFGAKGAMLQYYGIALILQFILQGIIASIIAKKYTQNIILICIFSILCCMSPIVFNRSIENTALAMNWLLMWAIYLYISRANYLGYKWNILTLFALGIHFYLFAMVQSIRFASFITQSKNIYKHPFHTTFSLFFGFILIYTSALIFGYMEVPADFNNQFGYGRGAANVLSLFHPFESGYSSIIKPHNWINNQYQGFAYLGVGLISSLSISLMILTISKNEFINFIKRHYSIILVFSFIFVISLGNEAYFLDTKIYSWTTKPFHEFSGWRRFILNTLSYTRDCGRLLWVLWYLIAVGSLIIILRLKTSVNIKTAIFLTIFSMQLVDFNNAFSINKVFSNVSKVFEFHFNEHQNLELDDITAKIFTPPSSVRIDKIVSYPAGNLVKKWDTLDLLALKLNVPINAGYWARFDSRKESLINEELRNVFEKGHFQKNILYVTQQGYEIPSNIKNHVEVIIQNDLLYLWVK